MRVGAIIQARMGSTRLPGKVLEPIEGMPMLARVVERIQRASLIQEVVVATTTKPSDDVIVNLSEELQVRVYRGQELDVLDRYYQAALAEGIDPVVRVTSDCPLIDPDVADLVIRRFLRGGADYLSNCLDRTFPRGLGVEAMSLSTLERAWSEASEDYDRTHVTSFIYRHPECFCLDSVTYHRDLSHLRWTVDTSEDLEFVRAVYSRLGDGDHFSWRKVLELLEREPELCELNRHIQQRALREG